MLTAYASAAVNTKAETIFIGGAFADAVLFMENQISEFDVEFEVVSKGICACSLKVPTVPQRNALRSILKSISPSLQSSIA